VNCNYRNYKIDFLRGIAILAVLILHFNISYHLDQSALNHIFSKDFIKAVASNGNYGVTIFFVISGFLITSTSLERYETLGNVDALGFYIFRFARIMPCLLLVLGLISLFSFLHIAIFQNNPNSTSFALGIFSVLTFWHNVLMEKIGYFNYCLNIFWSLSVEEIFYMVFPLLCLLLKKTRFILLFLITLIIISPIYRSHYTENEIVALYGYLSCFDAIAIGCVAAIISQKIQLNVWLRKVLLYSAGLFITGVYFYSGIMENVVLGVSLMAIGTAVFLISVSSERMANNTATGLFGRMICWFGKNSYELYLFHIVVLALMKAMVSRDTLGDYTKLLWMALFFGASVLVAGAISRFYSQPMNKKLRNLLFDYRQRKIFSPSLSSQTNISVSE
jgi:peptidoglycan/LPS O-acetylase OafA/YrhL